MKEIFKPIPGWPDYRAGSLGNIKRLPKETQNWRGRFTLKEKILNPGVNIYGYRVIKIRKLNTIKHFQVHQLVAMAFLGHVPNGHKLVVNHKDFNKLNNHPDNLEIVTQRENANLKHLKSTSKYIGVNWDKRRKIWRSRIKINGMDKHLGYFNYEIEASKAYQKKLNEIIN